MLIGRLKRLHNQLLVFVPEFKLKQILATAAALVFTVSAGSVRAQTFAVKQSSPFGISSSGIITFPNFVDLDNDGDPDLFIGEYNSSLEYINNSGSASSPSFDAPLVNQFGLLGTSDNIDNATFVDLDNDGDFDVMMGDASVFIKLITLIIYLSAYGIKYIYA